MEINSYLSSRLTLGLFVVLSFLGIYGAALVFESNFLLDIQKGTHGLIDPNLLVFGVLNLIVIAGLLLTQEKIPLRKLGLTNLKQGVWVLLSVWVLSQLITVAMNLITGHALQLHMIWTKWEPTYIFGFLFAMIFGTAFFEEVAFRGYLLPQLFHLIRRTPRTLWAILLCALLFSLFHVPSLLYIVQLSPQDMSARLIMLFGVGIITSLAYLRTGNIYALIAIHALNNAPTPLFQSDYSASTINGVVSMAILICWPYVFGNSSFLEWHSIRLSEREHTP